MRISSRPGCRALGGSGSETLFTPALARRDQRATIDPLAFISVSDTTVALDAVAVSESDGRLSTTVGSLVMTTVASTELDGQAALALLEPPAGEVLGGATCVGDVVVLAPVVEVPSVAVVVVAGDVGVTSVVVPAGVVVAPPGDGVVPLHSGGHESTGCCVKVFVVSGQKVPGTLPTAPTP